jgi:integrase
MTTFKLIPKALIPESDVRLWNNAIQPVEWFDDSSPAAAWSLASRQRHWQSYRRWLGYLHHTAQDVLALPPVERITEQRVRYFIEHLRQTVSMCGAWNYANGLLAIAKLFCPQQNWSWLSSAVSSLERLIVPRNKRPRLRSSHDLAALGQRLMDQADASTDQRPLEQAILYRDGLIIALLADRPVRRRNLAGIVIGHNLIKTSSGYDLHFPNDETKTGAEIRFSVPDPLIARLTRYLDHYRPLFPGARSHLGLWASTSGGRLLDDAIYSRIIKHTEAAFGQSVNPHLFRDALATTLAIECPDKIGVASRMLGHSTETFTQAHYIQAGTVSASRTYQDTLRELRKELAGNRQQQRPTPEERGVSNSPLGRRPR